MDSKTLQKKATELRLVVLEAIAKAGKGHIGGSFSCLDVLVSLFYGDVLRFDAKNPQWRDRDRFILSKGHTGVALYAVLADLGYFDPKELDRVNNKGILGEHPDNGVPGVEINSGSLGHGLGIGSGMALAAKLDGKDYLTVCLLGDGECYEGSVWESAQFASHLELNNLVAIVDRNRLIVNGFTEEINKMDSMAEKWSAFGWEALEVDGHFFSVLISALQGLRRRKSKKPLVLIANTQKGKGVSFMEDQAKWHHGGIGGEVFEKAKQELLSQIRGV